LAESGERLEVFYFKAENKVENYIRYTARMSEMPGLLVFFSLETGNVQIIRSVTAGVCGR